MRHWGLGVRLVGAAVAASSPLAAAQAAADCYDSLVLADIRRQTPTIMPDCGNDCIVMRWPWIVELDVERVVRGTPVPSRLTILTVQHSEYRSDLGVRRWWLRRNRLGGFNLLGMHEGARYPRCPRGTPPAEPFIAPGKGRTLRDVLRESREHDRKGPRWRVPPPSKPDVAPSPPPAEAPGSAFFLLLR